MPGTGRLDPRRAGLLTFETLEGLRPTQDHVLLKVIPPPAVSGGGIHIPANARHAAFWECEVIAVGPGRWQGQERVPVEVRPGERVLCRADPGWELGDYRMLREGAIEGVLEL